jgi:oligopeptide/dipeptide ABC transporter ATP-binding protein
MGVVTEPSGAPAGIDAQIPEVVAVAEEEPIEYGNFTQAQLETALLSEFGGMRGYLPQATQGYYDLAIETGDINIIRRASEFVSASGNTEALNVLAQLWISKDATAQEPHLMLGYQLMEDGRFVQALSHLDSVLELGGQVDFTAMSARTYTLENRQRDVIISQLEDIVSRYPQEQTLYLAISQMYDQSSQGEQAAQWLQVGRDKFGDNPRTLLIEAQLLQNMGRAEQAEGVLTSAVAQFPDHRLLRYSLAQLLVQNNKLAEAALEFEYIMQREPMDFETLYSLVLINLELEDYTKAEPQLRELIGAGHRLNEANYYLAIILEDRDQTEEALDRYQQISIQSNAFLTAQRQIMRLLIQLERFDDAENLTRRLADSDPRLAPLIPALEAEALANADHNTRALTVLNQALTRFPDDIDLLFARALIAEQPVCLMDEPLSNLDAKLRQEMRREIRDLQQKLGLTYLFISHNLAVVRQVSDRVGVMYLGRLVELAPAETLFTTPRHPYTRALMEAIPDLEMTGRQRIPVGGEVPSPISPPSGCPFHPRCALANDRCKAERPELKPARGTEQTAVACHAVEEGRDGGAEAAAGMAALVG